MNWPWKREEPEPVVEPEPGERYTWNVVFKDREDKKVEGTGWERRNDTFIIRDGVVHIFYAHWDDIHYVEKVGEHDPR